MRGLDELEFAGLDRCARRADGESLEWCEATDAQTSAMMRLVGRGLVRKVPDPSWRFGWLYEVEPLGRIALRVERLIRSGGAKVAA